TLTLAASDAAPNAVFGASLYLDPPSAFFGAPANSGTTAPGFGKAYVFREPQDVGAPCTIDLDCIRGVICVEMVCTSCQSDADCDRSKYCAADHGCHTRKGQALGCDVAAGADCAEENCRVCQSGHCADGVCCNSACDGTCTSCALPDYVGTCTPVEGPPH